MDGYARDIEVLTMRMFYALDTGQRLGFSLLVQALTSNALAMEDIEQSIEMEGGTCYDSILTNFYFTCKISV